MNCERSELLFGDSFALQRLKILIIGAGGVGGYALLGLYRSGIRDIDIVDYDVFESSNQNRQIGSENVGEKKVLVLSKMFAGIGAIDAKVDGAWLDDRLAHYDYVVDAIDDIGAKVAIAKRVHKNLISSLGSAKRLDPTKIRLGNIKTAQGDGFARKFRSQLRQEGVSANFRVVYSIEDPITNQMGSFVGVTASFGLTIASEIIRSHINNLRK